MPREICPVGVNEALATIADHPLKPGLDIVIHTYPTAGGLFINLNATGEAAARLTGDQAIIHVGLERNPDQETTILTVARITDGKPESSQAIFDPLGTLVHTKSDFAVAASGTIFASIKTELG